jgi:hypothetical protein
MSAQQAHTIGKLLASTNDQVVVFDHLKTAADGAASTATSEVPVGMARRSSRVLAAYFVPAASLTADNTNNATIIVSKRAAGGGSKTTVASATTAITGTGNFTAWVPVPLTVVSADATVTALSQLSFEITKGGTGVVVPIGKLVVYLTDNY